MYSVFFNGIDHTAPGISAYFFEMVEFGTFVTPLAIHWASSQCVFLSTVFTSSSSVQCICCRSFVSVLDIVLYDCIKRKTFFASCKLLTTASWALWASTPSAQFGTFSLCMVLHEMSRSWIPHWQGVTIHGPITEAKQL